MYFIFGVGDVISQYSSVSPGRYPRSPWRKATFEKLRRAFLKIAVRIEELESRIKIALPSIGLSLSQGLDHDGRLRRRSGALTQAARATRQASNVNPKPVQKSASKNAVNPADTTRPTQIMRRP